MVVYLEPLLDVIHFLKRLCVQPPQCFGKSLEWNWMVLLAVLLRLSLRFPVHFLERVVDVSQPVQVGDLFFVGCCYFFEVLFYPVHFLFGLLVNLYYFLLVRQN